ncbi:MAG: Nif3-like dinuclear metal center hexameric protein [Nanoarchaeota archaeon]
MNEIKLNDIVNFLNTYLENDKFIDSSYNGLQFEGKKTIKKIAFAVDSGIEIFNKAIKENADMLIVHHGLFWQGNDQKIINTKKKRLEILFKNNLSLYASHLPLDKHKVVGNNAQLLKLLDAKIIDEFANYKNQSISWIGKLKNSKTITEISKILDKKLDKKCKILNFGKEKIKTIAVCSGGGSINQLIEAINYNVDLFLTGEESEIYHEAKDSNINVIFSGHNATETLGVRALAKIIEKKFKINTIFINHPTNL